MYLEAFLTTYRTSFASLSSWFSLMTSFRLHVPGGVPHHVPDVLCLPLLLVHTDHLSDFMYLEAFLTTYRTSFACLSSWFTLMTSFRLHVPGGVPHHVPDVLCLPLLLVLTDDLFQTSCTWRRSSPRTGRPLPPSPLGSH